MRQLSYMPLLMLTAFLLNNQQHIKQLIGLQSISEAGLVAFSDRAAREFFQQSLLRSSSSVFILKTKNMDHQADQQVFNEYPRCTTSTTANAQTSLNNLQKNPRISRKDRDFLKEADHYDKENSSEVSLRSKDDRDDNEVIKTTHDMISNDFIICSQQASSTQSKDVSSFTNYDPHPSLVLPIHASEDVNLLASNASIAMDKRQADESGNGNNGFDVIPISLKLNLFVFMGSTVPQKKQILHGVTGYVLSGELLALMGPSGSGKTTLINLLSGRKNASKGSITYNDVPYSSALKRRMGFVMQDDILHSHLTVLETLQYAALLRLPGSLSKADKLCRAMEVISLLGLESCKDTIIGEPFLHGISGGERKRVSVGCEILTNPSLLFLDEPPSGLGSTIALRIVQILQGFSKVGRSVVTTIHQPSSRLFYMFDKLILLSKGRIVYFGEAQAAMEFFSSIQLRPLIAMNPADFLLDLANGNLADMSLPVELEHRVSYARNDTFSLSLQFQLEAKEALGTAIGAAMMDVKKAIVFGAVMVLTFMLAGGFFVQHLPRFIAWVRYVSINFYSFILLVKVQYDREQKYNCQKFSGCESIAASPALHNVSLGGGASEALILIAMAVSYHFLAYIFLSRMKLTV
ncbi:hypothetical protein L7F22_002540 [Adiantum nelumboides]|nr:hypothetical protein [Adiantum nelumboides]